MRTSYPCLKSWHRGAKQQIERRCKFCCFVASRHGWFCCLSFSMMVAHFKLIPSHDFQWIMPIPKRGNKSLLLSNIKRLTDPEPASVLCRTCWRLFLSCNPPPHENKIESDYRKRGQGTKRLRAASWWLAVELRRIKEGSTSTHL